MSDEASDAERSGPAVRALIALEDDAPDELFEALPGATVPLWAIVRMRFAWALSEQQTGSVEVKSDNWSRRSEARRVARALLPNRWDAARRSRPHDVLFYVGGGTLAAREGRARNWLIDDFAESAHDAAVVQSAGLPSPVGPPDFQPTLSMDAGLARSLLRGRWQHPTDEAVRTTDRLLGWFADHLGVADSTVAAIKSRVMRTQVVGPHELDELRRTVKRTQPRVVIMDTASYTYNGEIVGVFKDAGAYVAEPQHGWIGRSHAAYNYGRAFEDPRLSRALPNELLTFGQYWSESVRFPGAVTAIGKPHLERLAAQTTGSRRRRVLVISSRARPESTDEFVVGLRAGLGSDWEVVFRPHPGERSAVGARYPRTSAAQGVSIDLEPDVYVSLAQARVVVGVASTVLFEAVAFGCKVIARDDDFAATVIGEYFGARAGSAEEVVARMQEIDDEGIARGNVDPRMWAPDAVGRFSAWLDGRLAGSQNGAIG